jgi:hypothetical protein
MWAKAYVGTSGTAGSLQGLYLGCACDSTTGVFQHLFTDGRTIYATAHGLHVVPDAYPLPVKIRNNATFGYIRA